jgi:hypothetical protein
MRRCDRRKGAVSAAARTRYDKEECRPNRGGPILFAVRWVAPAAITLAALAACSSFQAASEPPGSALDGGLPDAAGAAPKRLCASGPHTLCDDFDTLDAGALDLSRWDELHNVAALQVVDAGATTPPFALRYTGAVPPLGGRAALSAPLPVPTTRVTCSLDVRVATAPANFGALVLALEFSAADVTSDVLVFAYPDAIELGIYEAYPVAEPGYFPHYDPVPSRANNLVRLTLDTSFTADSTIAKITSGTASWSVTRPRTGAPSAPRVTVGVANASFPDAGTLDVLLDTFACDVQ